MSYLEPLQNPVGWILYDESCGFCARWVPFWGTTLRNVGIDFAPIQAEWVQKRLQLSVQDSLKDIRLLLADGGLIQGADVYRYAMGRIWWARPLSLASRLPGLRILFDTSYRIFAKHRYQVSKACGWEGRPPVGRS